MQRKQPGSYSGAGRGRTGRALARLLAGFALLGLVLGAGDGLAAQKRRRGKRLRGQPTGLVPSAANPLMVPVDPIARARAREELTLARSTATVARARAQALIAYRLARRRSAEFLGDPARRAETARALDAALLVLKRSAFESSALERELVLARAERTALETGAHPRPPVIPPAPIDPADDWPLPLPAAPLAWPTRGTVVSGPGRRRDPATGTEAVSEGVEILSRMNEPAHAVAAGRVRRISPLPQGGYAVVLAHREERVSITSGLRQVDVAAGAELKAGEVLGLVGRDLDGAPVLTFELWQAGVPVDPRLWLPTK